MRWITFSLLGLLAALLIASPISADGSLSKGGSMKLPLPDYLNLVDQVAAIDLEAQREAEKTTADLAMQKVSITIIDDTDGLLADGLLADIETVFQVELAGTPTQAVRLPFSGMAETVRVEPRQEASLNREAGHLVFYAPQPGSYEITVSGRQILNGNGGVHRLKMAASQAPVSSVEVHLAASIEWNCAGTVTVKDEERQGRRLLQLAPKRGQEHVLELRRQTRGHEQDRTFARSSVVTLVEVRPQGTLARQDVVFYEVLRGDLGAFELSLPTGLELERVATDEGDALPQIDGEKLTVKRQRRLSNNGHLVVTYQAQSLSAGPVSLAPIVPQAEPRGHYLVTTSAVAARVEPQPAASWRRIDLDDLPQQLRSEIADLRPNALWQWAGKDEEPQLLASPLTEAKRLTGVVRNRLTTTLLTVDGSLVHRDHYELETSATAFEVQLSPQATLWSAQVDGVAVRPLQKDATTLVVPLTFKSEGMTLIELVSVEERTLKSGRSRIRISAPRPTEAVVRHEWRLLLPDQHRYRLARSELQAVSDQISEPVRFSYHPIPGLSGVVVDSEGDPLPGATVEAQGSITRRVAITDRFGYFALPNLPRDVYNVVASLEGFSTAEQPHVSVVKGRATQIELTLSAAIEETITVSGTSARLDRRRLLDNAQTKRSEDPHQAAGAELGHFRQGLVAGVKPLAVEIPESGKLLVLSGALPPAQVTVELEVDSIYYHGVGGDALNLTQVVFEVWDGFSPEPTGFGAEDFGWLEVLIDPTDPAMFGIQQHFVDAPTP